MASEIAFRRTALKQLRALDPTTRDRILVKLKWFAAQDDPISFARPLKDSKIGTHRFRVGEWRITFIANENELTFVDIGHRREIYR